MFDSVVRVYLGKTLLVDSTSQYGLYAWFLAPLFRCIGLSVAKFTFVMGLLSAVSFFMIGVFLWRLMSHLLLAVGGLIATLFNGWMLFLTVEGPHRGAILIFISNMCLSAYCFRPRYWAWELAGCTRRQGR